MRQDVSSATQNSQLRTGASLQQRGPALFTWCDFTTARRSLAAFLVPGLWSAGSVPGDGLLYGVAVRGGLKVAEGGFEFAGIDDEGRAELVGGLAHLAEQ